MAELTHSPRSGVAPGSWLARWSSACADLEDLFSHHHLLDATIEEIDGRRIRVGHRWLIDFASCNYLGLDLDRQAATTTSRMRSAPQCLGRKAKAPAARTASADSSLS